MEFITILIIILLLFGTSRLPSVGKGLGKAIGNLKKGFSENKKADAKTKKEVSEEDKTGKR